MPKAKFLRNNHRDKDVFVTSYKLLTLVSSKFLAWQGKQTCFLLCMNISHLNIVTPGCLNKQINLIVVYFQYLIFLTISKNFSKKNKTIAFNMSNKPSSFTLDFLNVKGIGMPYNGEGDFYKAICKFSIKM